MNKKLKYWRIRIFGLTWITYALFYICRKNFSIAMPLMSSEYDISKEDLALSITVYSIMYMLGQFLSGFFNDKNGPRLVVTIGMLISVVANLLMGWYYAPYMLVMLMGMNGLGQSSGWSGTIKNLTPWFCKKERGRVMSFWTTNYVVGGILATAFATYWISNNTFAQELGWHRVFWFPALVLFIVAIVYVVFTRNTPSEAGINGSTAKGHMPDNKSNDTIAYNSQKSKNRKDVFKSKALWTAASVYFFVKLTRYAFLFWLPLYLTEALAYDVSAAGYSSIAYEAVGFGGIIFAGYFSDKYFKSKRFPVVAIMLIGLSIVLALNPILSVQGVWPMVLSIGLIGFFTYGPDSILSGATAMDIGKEENAAKAAGIINGVGSAGQLISPVLVAYITINYGWDSLFKLFIVLALIASSIAFTRWNFGKISTRHELLEVKLNTSK